MKETGEHAENTCLTEVELLQDEWRETRASIDRFDHILVDLRKYGFSLITLMITASSVAFEATGLNSVLPVLVVPFAIMILICGLFLVDRYYEVLLLGCVLRSRQLEDASQEILETYIKSKVYLRMNLSAFLEDKVQDTRARLFSFFVYLLFIVASFLLGLFSLLTYYEQHGLPVSSVCLAVLIVVGGSAVVFLVVINSKMAALMERLREDIIIDDRIIIRKLFTREQVTDAIERLAREVDFVYSHRNFKILTLGIGGLQFAQRLIGELKRLGRTNIESISVFSEKVRAPRARKGQERGSKFEVKITPPERHLLQDEEILIVDDLVATGATLQKLIDICWANNAKSVRSCILLDAPEQREVEGVPIDFKGLTTAEKGRFVGCGMDFNFECRELPYIGVVKSYKPKKTV